MFAELKDPLRRLLGEPGQQPTHGKLLNYCVGQLPQQKPLPGIIDLIQILTRESSYTQDEAVRLLAALHGHSSGLPAPVDAGSSFDACRAPMIEKDGLLATPAGLVIAGAGMWSDFWFIPRTDLEKAINDAAK
jgi:hypothetical protein